MMITGCCAEDTLRFSNNGEVVGHCVAVLLIFV